jgi:hypothetical protein
VELDEDLLPTGVWETEDEQGKIRYMARCRACGRDFDWMFDESPYDTDPYYILCFGSDRCVP